MGINKVDKWQALKQVNAWGFASFTALQDEVFENCGYMNSSREFIIGATSSGKTLIPLICFKLGKEMYEKKEKLLYIVPYRALATQKAKEIAKKFPEEKMVVSTSEYCFDDINVMSGNCDIAIVIYEKVYMFLSNNKKFLEQYTYIVFDELGIVEDLERGLKTDYLLYMACKFTHNNIYVLATPYFGWDKYIEVYGFSVHQESKRPVEIVNTLYKYNVADNDGICIQDSDDEIFDICQKHRKQGQKILVFANSRKRVKDLSNKLFLSFYGDYKTNEIKQAKIDYLSQLVMSEDDLFDIMSDIDYVSFKYGIAFHNSSLPEEVRELIEREFLSDDGKLNILVSTETLAYGLNSNVDVVVVAEMEKPVGNRQRRFLTVNEYQNFIGRAGRLGQSQIGYSYTLINDRQEKLWEELREKIHNPDLIESQYSFIYLQDECIFHMLNFIDVNGGVTIEEINNTICSFPCESVQHQNVLRQKIDDLLERNLISKEYCELDECEYYKITALGRRTLGFIISVDTYDHLVSISSSQAYKDNFFMFDYLMTISRCKEMEIGDYFDRNNARDYVLELSTFLNKMEEKGLVSKKLKKEIGMNKSIAKFRNISTKCNANDWSELRKVRIAEALYMWIECYSMQIIKSKCGFDYAQMKKFGEKAKYITDIISADISMHSHVMNMELKLKMIGLALYYGIRIEIIETLGITELEPISGRQLRTISRILNIQENNALRYKNKLKKMMSQIKTFPAEYQVLVNEVRV